MCGVSISAKASACRVPVNDLETLTFAVLVHFMPGCATPPGSRAGLPAFPEAGKERSRGAVTATRAEAGPVPGHDAAIAAGDQASANVESRTSGLCRERARKESAARA